MCPCACRFLNALNNIRSRNPNVVLHWAFGFFRDGCSTRFDPTACPASEGGVRSQSGVFGFYSGSWSGTTGKANLKTVVQAVRSQGDKVGVVMPCLARMQLGM